MSHSTLLHLNYCHLIETLLIQQCNDMAKKTCQTLYLTPRSKNAEEIARIVDEDLYNKKLNRLYDDIIVTELFE